MKNEIKQIQETIEASLEESTIIEVVNSDELEFHQELELSNGNSILINLEDYTIYYVDGINDPEEFNDVDEFLSECSI